jgi:hypothetical protein
MPTTDYGSDLSTFADVQSGIADLDPTFAVISGPRVVIERIARKLMTPTGSMLRAGWGYDLRAHLQDSMTAGSIGALQGIIQGQIEEEQEVESSAVAVTYSLETRTLTVTARIVLVTGETFDMVFTLTPDRAPAVVIESSTE